jgi:transcriptional regulator with XRE-family HTH domain
MYEAGKREPDFETLEAIADFFNVDMDYLLGRTDKTTYIPGSQTDNRMKLPGYFKQYIFEEDIASYALKLKREPVLKEILDAVELLNDSNRRIILFLAGKLKEEQGK